MMIIRPLALLVLLPLFFSCQKEPEDIFPDPGPDPLQTRTLLPHIFKSDAGYDSLVYDDAQRLIERWSWYDGYFRKKVYGYNEKNMPAYYEIYDVFPGPLSQKNVYTEDADGTVSEVATRYGNGREFPQYFTHRFNEKGQLVASTRDEDGRLRQDLSWDEKGRVQTTGHFDNSWITRTYTYDDKKGVFSSVKAPFIYDEYSMDGRCFAVNNLLKMTMSYISRSSGEEVTTTIDISYTYNDDGYPIILHTDEENAELFINNITYMEVEQ